MILTRDDIKQRIESGELAFTPPLDQYQNQPHAVDMRLGTKFYIPKIWEQTEHGREVLKVDVTKNADKNYEIVELKPGQYFELAPGESIIASTYENIKLNAPDLMGILYPRSSINRRGLSVDLTGIVDAYYSGSLMIPILINNVSDHPYLPRRTDLSGRVSQARQRAYKRRGHAPWSGSREIRRVWETKSFVLKKMLKTN